MLFEYLFWEVIYLQYISDTFWLDVDETKKLTESKVHGDGGEMGMLFYLFFLATTKREIDPNHSTKKREFGHNHCMYRFLSINPSIAMYILTEGDRVCFIDDTCISQKLRHRVKTMSYDELFTIHTDLEVQADRLIDPNISNSKFKELGRKVVKGGHVNGSEIDACIEQQQSDKFRMEQSKRAKKSRKSREKEEHPTYCGLTKKRGDIIL